MPVFQKIFTFVKVNIFSHFCLFNVIKINRVGDFKYLKSLFHFSFLVYSLSKPLVKLSQRGMLLLEMILIALFLGAIALSTSYYFTQTQATLSSSSQVTNCQNIVKQALESTVSLGARLYGYKMNHRDSGLRYTPLFIKKDSSKSWDMDGNIEDVNDGSQLSFPPQLYKTLYKNLGISASSKKSPEDNTGKALIGDTYPYDISTSTLLVNSVNALQYLYNLDNGFFTANSGQGKKYTTSTIGSGNISSVLKKYERQFDLEDIEFYIKISPIDLQTNKVMTSPPSQILTRPRFHNPNNVTVIPALNVLGDDNIGFEIKALLKYEREDQDYECEGSHRFTHQIKPITQNNRPLSASLTGLTSGASKDFLTDSTLKNTSCDTDGTGYDDITVTVDFSRIEEGQQLGTVILCRMSSYCRSYGNGSYGSCSPVWGHWQRCHDIKPKPSSDQSWTYKAKLKAAQELVMTFEDMKIDRRYELDIGEFSITGYNLRFRNRATFFIDAKRPHVVNMRITNDAVGRPKDGREGRNYNGPSTNWITPPKSTSDWLQCNTSKVEFAGDIDDQFTHNLKDCVLTGSRKDGNGTSTTSPTSIADCAGELSSIAHGRQTIKFLPSDDCSHRVTPPDLGTPKDLVWDTDLPSTFASQNFSSDPMWFFNTSKNAYSVDTVVPGTGAGKFPKHYSVDCDDNFLNTAPRKDGNSKILSCSLGGSNPDHDDGCNPNKVAVRYYHVCGGAGVCEQSNWGVYAPQGENCQNVSCEPGLICCDGYRNECGSVSTNQCETDSYPHECTNPKGGGRSQQDSASGCPPLGLYDCNYSLTCLGTSPFSATDTSACIGKREGDTCSFSYGGAVSCNPDTPTGWQTTMPNKGGTCNYPGGYTVSCMAPHRERCRTPCSHTCYDPCHPSGHQQNGVTVPCTHITCNPRKCHQCDQMEYKVDGAHPNSSCPTISVSGRCGPPSGGCSPLGLGGGNLSAERCTIRPATCNCNSATTCCPGDIYPTNFNCPCNSATTCCPGDTFPTNSNCPPPCDSVTHCCPGDSYPANPNCAPNNSPSCNSATTCCTGDSYPANPNCDPKKVDGECSENGCKKGIKKSGTGANAGDWKCEGLNGGTTTDWCKGKPLCKPNDCSKECCQENKCCGECKCGKASYISGPDVVVATCEYDHPMNYINTCPGTRFYQPYIYGPVSKTRSVNTRVNYSCVGYTGDYETATAKNCFYHIEKCRSNDGVYPCYRFTHHYGSTGCKGFPICCSESPCGP